MFAPQLTAIVMLCQGRLLCLGSDDDKEQSKLKQVASERLRVGEETYWGCIDFDEAGSELDRILAKVQEMRPYLLLIDRPLVEWAAELRKLGFPEGGNSAERLREIATKGCKGELEVFVGSLAKLVA
jgi:hypothetical protein